jgi:hypothetical protein
MEKRPWPQTRPLTHEGPPHVASTQEI